jgi:hypothetical protein
VRDGIALLNADGTEARFLRDPEEGLPAMVFDGKPQEWLPDARGWA